MRPRHVPGLARTGAYARPLVLLAIATLIACLIANLLSVVEHHERLGMKMTKKEENWQDIANPAEFANAANGALPVPEMRKSHPTGGVGWNGERAAELRSICGDGRKGTILAQELIYPRGRYLHISSSNSPSDPYTIKYLLSLNSPQDDAVVSKGILHWLNSPPGTYPSSTQVHTLCTALPQTEQVGGRWLEPGMKAGFALQVATEPLVRCGGGRVAVEVGSAIGMVSMYLAERNMRVYALDPVLPNVQRMRESACLNGMRRCMRRHAQRHAAAAQALQDCRNSSAWESFSPANLTLVHSVADRSTGTSRMVRALSSNLAATDSKSSWADGNRGSSPYASQVATLALDDLLEDLHTDIELLHMCPQGEEFRVLEGAFHLIEAGRVVNILFGLYYDEGRAREQVPATLHTCQPLDVLMKVITAIGYLI